MPTLSFMDIRFPAGTTPKMKKMAFSGIACNQIASNMVDGMLRGLETKTATMKIVRIKDTQKSVEKILSYAAPLLFDKISIAASLHSDPRAAQLHSKPIHLSLRTGESDILLIISDSSDVIKLWESNLEPRVFTSKLTELVGAPMNTTVKPDAESDDPQ